MLRVDAGLAILNGRENIHVSLPLTCQLNFHSYRAPKSPESLHDIWLLEVSAGGRLAREVAWKAAPCSCPARAQM